MNDVKMRIDSKELQILDKENKDIESLNQNILVMRKKQLYGQLAESSNQRLRLLKSITKWIEMLEVKIFDADNIDEMDIDKAISLFKYVSNLNLKTLVQTDRLEEVLGKYLDSGALELQKGINDGSIDVKQDVHLIKKEIMETIAGLVHKNTSDAVIIENEEIIVDKGLEEEVDDIITDIIPDIELDLD